MKTHTFMIIGFVLAALFTSHTAEANHTWGPYHWARTANPFTLKLGDNLTNAWDPYLAQTSSDWSSSTVLDTVIVPGGTNGTRGRLTPKYCTPTSGRAEVCNAKYGSTGWLGIASIWISGDHITAGTVKLNDTYYTTATYNTAAWKNLVMCQEVGHIFGLSHQDENFSNPNLNTCMDYTNNPTSNQHPNAHDYEMLETIYAHLDTSTTLASTKVNAGFMVDSNNASDWGEEVYRSPNKHSSIFKKDFGNGHHVLRHVYWIEPHDENHL